MRDPTHCVSPILPSGGKSNNFNSLRQEYITIGQLLINYAVIFSLSDVCLQFVSAWPLWLKEYSSPRKQFYRFSKVDSHFFIYRHIIPSIPRPRQDEKLCYPFSACCCSLERHCSYSWYQFWPFNQFATFQGQKNGQYLWSCTDDWSPSDRKCWPKKYQDNEMGSKPIRAHYQYSKG